MTSPRIDRSIAAHDDDLDQTIIDMTPSVIRLGIKESAAVALERQEQFEAARTPHAIAASIRDTLKLRADRLKVTGEALRLIIEEHERFRRIAGRRPNMEQLTRAVEAAEERLQQAALTDEQIFYAARAVAKSSRKRAELAADGSRYLRASA